MAAYVASKHALQVRQSSTFHLHHVITINKCNRKLFKKFVTGQRLQSLKGNNSHSCQCLWGSLSDDDDDVSELQYVAKKINLCPFKFDRVYPLSLSNVGDFSWSWIIKVFIPVQKEKGKLVVVCSSPVQNVALGGFRSKSCSGRKRNELKSFMNVQNCCFVHKTNWFLDVIVVVVMVA